MGGVKVFRNTVVFPSVPSAVADARAWLTAVLPPPPGIPDDMAAAATLALSEAATNAVRHADGADFRVRTTLGPWWLRVECEDAGGATVPQIRDAGPCEEGGRGLALIAAFTHTWGPLRDGRHGVFFHLDWHPSTLRTAT